ncbi:MAG: glycerophosphodiester phosphodiesterase [Desulfobacteraceae bacterium]|nr:glycerophosphodiester phosphodiesterase [Desulfobacteraceae bacterium]
MRPLPWLIAHRGAMAEAPENVEAAFELAFSYAVDGVELDVQMTADGVPVVFHDETLRRITGQRCAVADREAAELLEIDFGGWYSEKFRGQQLMTLESILQRYSGRGILMIELKSECGGQSPDAYLDRLCREAARLIDLHVSRHLQDEIFILGFDGEMIAKSQEMSPQLKHILNIKKPVYPNRKKLPVFEDLWGYCLPRRKFTRDFAGLCHERGLHIAVYSCNTSGQVFSAIEAGADVVMTDDPARVSKAFFNHYV